MFSDEGDSFSLYGRVKAIVTDDGMVFIHVKD